MKRLNYLILLAAAALAAGCAKELPSKGDDLLVGTQEVVIDLTMPGSETKTILGAKDGSSYPVYWQTGDQVSLNGALSVAVPAADNGTNKTSLYVKNASISSPFNVLYPGEAGVSDKVTFPSSQDYTPDTFAANSLPLYATAASLTDGFSLNYLGAVLRIPVKFTSATTLKQITLTTVNGEPLGGTFNIGKTSGALNGELSANTTVSTIYYNFGASGTAFAADQTGVFYIAIPKGAYAKGLEMKAYDMDGNYMKASLFSETGTVAPGKVYEFTERAFNPDGTAFFIENVADLQAFATKSGERYCLLEAIVLNDIDMSGQEYNAGAFSFYGTLDGGGHSISGLDKPLFNNIYGSVKNLTVSADITDAVISGSNSYGLGILARYAYVSSGDEQGDYGQVIENVTTNGSITISHTSDVDFSVGGMLGANKGIPMSSCVNNASVTITSYTATASGVTRAGGLCGSVISSSANISGCSNTGDVTVTNAVLYDSGSLLEVGGITGYDTKDNTIQNCTNSGAVTISAVSGASDSTPYLLAGGILGNSTADGFTISGCENLADGTVTIGEGCTVQATRIGGVAGRTGGAGSEVTGCTNRALVDIKAATLSGSNYFGGVLGAALADNQAISGCKNYGEVKNAASRLDAMAGVIGYASENATISGCENYGDVSSTATPSGLDAYLAGVVGKKYKAKTISFSDCKNEGDITLTCGTHGKSVYLGGIIAGCPGGSSTFTNCSNSGDITNNGEKATKDEHHDGEGTEVTGISFTPAISMGGIIGRVTDNAISSITDCSNSGAVINNCPATEIRIGGIVGYTHQVINEISGCTNSGLISNNVLADFCYIHVAGIVGYTNAKINMSAQNTNTGKIQSNPTSRVDICGLTEYDDNVRLAGCIATYNCGTRGTLEDQKNEGEIVNAGSESCGWVYMGGLSGYAQTATFTGALNTGYVHNEATVRVKLDIAGVMGRSDHSSQAKIQEQTVNEGNVFNNGVGEGDVYIAGLCAEVVQSTELTNSTNKGTIKNNGTATKCRMAGVCASSAKYVNLDYSSNEGDVIFEGTTSNAVFIGGVMGYDQNTNGSSRIRYNSNSGAISCNVAVPKDLEIAGIVADCYGEVKGCENSGPITIAGNVGGSIYVSGICGYNCDVKAMSSCENKAGGTITMDGAYSVGSQIFCGGVLGSEPKGKSLTHSDFINRAKIVLGSSETNRLSTAKTSFSYIGGCVGGNGDGTNACTYNNMENYGKITFYGMQKVRLGGCVAYAPTLSGTLINRADIKYMQRPTDADKSLGNSQVGGIAAYCQNATLEGAVCVGKVDTYASKYRALTGGIVGVAPSAMTKIKGCTYKGDLRGTTSGASAGLMCAVESTGRDISFEDCIIGTGTRWYHSGSYRTVTNLVLNYSDVGSATDTAMLCGSGSSDSNGSSAGTMNNCTIATVN